MCGTGRVMSGWWPVYRSLTELVSRPRYVTPAVPTSVAAGPQGVGGRPTPPPRRPHDLSCLVSVTPTPTTAGHHPLVTTAVRDATRENSSCFTYVIHAFFNPSGAAVSCRTCGAGEVMLSSPPVIPRTKRGRETRQAVVGSSQRDNFNQCLL